MIGVHLVSLGTRHESELEHHYLTGISVGAFVAAPVGGLMWGAGAFALRVGLQWVQAKRKGHRFDAFDRPSPIQPLSYISEAGSFDEEHQEGQEHVVPSSVSPQVS